MASHHGFHLNDSQDRVFLWSHSGLWKRCDYFDADLNPVCQYHQDFAAENRGAGAEFLRAEVAVVVLVIVMIVVAASFSLYSLVHPRYMFKRLAGFLHIMTTITLLVRVLRKKMFTLVVLVILLFRCCKCVKLANISLSPLIFSTTVMWLGRLLCYFLKV